MRGPEQGPCGNSFIRMCSWAWETFRGLTKAWLGKEALAPARAAKLVHREALRSFVQMQQVINNVEGGRQCAHPSGGKSGCSLTRPAGTSAAWCEDAAAHGHPALSEENQLTCRISSGPGS